MEVYKIYLAGGMGNFGDKDFDKSNSWRLHCKSELNSFAHNFYTNYSLKIINPNDYYNFKDSPARYKTQREVMEYDLNHVRTSNLIIVNFNDVYSLGTMAELAIAYELKIPIIGLNKDDLELHPWQIEMTNRIFNDLDKLLDYIEQYYLT